MTAPGTCGQRGRDAAVCTRPAGHDGGHLDAAKDIYWPEDGDAK